MPRTSQRPRRVQHGVTLAFLGLAGLAVLALAGCPSPKSPTGQPPEYEDPPAPSWFDAGPDAPAPAPAPLGDR